MMPGLDPTDEVLGEITVALVWLGVALWFYVVNRWDKEIR
jgi:hypothetical protein